MLNFTKSASRLVTKTAQQIGTELIDPPEKFRQNLLLRIYFMKKVNFLIHDMKHGKMKVLGFLAVQNIVSYKP